MPVRTIDYCPAEYQEDYHLSPSRFKIIAGGRRVGKSLACFHEALRICLTIPSAIVWWVSPTLSDAREIGWEYLKRTLPDIQSVVYSMNETRMVCTFRNSSKFLFKSAERETALRGRGLDHLVVDEAAFISPETWNRILRPALSDRNGSATLCSTPNGRNWFWEMYEKAKICQKHEERKKTWDHFHWPTSLNSLISAQEVADAKRELSILDFSQEYLAEFVTRAGLVYSEFNDDNILESFTLEPRYDIYLGADFGFANPAAFVFMAVDPLTENVFQFDEVYAARKSIHELAEEIQKKLTKWNITKSRVKSIFSDPAGNAEEITSGISPVDFLRMEEGYEVINKGTFIAPGLSLVRSFIHSAAGERRFFILKDCINTLNSMKGYTYVKHPTGEIVKEEPLKDGINDHCCDAVRYFFVNRFDKAKWVTKGIETRSYLIPPKDFGGKKMHRCGKCRNMYLGAIHSKPPYICQGCRQER